MNAICEQNCAYFGSECVDFASLRLETAKRMADHDIGSQRTVFVVDSMREALGCVALGLSRELDFGVIERNRISTEVKDRFAENKTRLVNAVDGSTLAGANGGLTVPGRVTVLTSGTTGLLKLIPHTAATLNTFDRVQDLPENTWFLPYQIGSYAWYQVVTLAMIKQGQNLVPGDFTDLASSFEEALKRGVVTAISSTPTFWRYALMSIDETLLASAPLRNVSLGGEIVDQPILDRLSMLYPQARIRHIYASSEAGAAIIVSDGKAGFDAKLAARSDGTYRHQGRR